MQNLNITATYTLDRPWSAAEAIGLQGLSPLPPGRFVMVDGDGPAVVVSGDSERTEVFMPAATAFDPERRSGRFVVERADAFPLDAGSASDLGKLLTPEIRADLGLPLAA